MRVARSIAGLLTLVAMAAASTGCTHVAAYERGRLANPMMTADLEGPAAAHVYDVHEGATGGGSPTAGGCGCN
jgi:hypothetical protein